MHVIHSIGARHQRCPRECRPVGASVIWERYRGHVRTRLLTDCSAEDDCEKKIRMMAARSVRGARRVRVRMASPLLKPAVGVSALLYQLFIVGYMTINANFVDQAMTARPARGPGPVRMAA